MRNLKKTLCLFLALVFVLGLCTVGAADIVFTDEQSIQYKEAVQTMAGLGILKGYEDGSFKPAQSLTRAEAAKIIAYVAGGENVDNGATEQIFDDVPTSHWANKYIAYCYRKNIINGVGANKFDPNGKVTRNAVMKMLLAACGYGSQGEFTGAEWDSEVFKVANETKILQGFKAADWSGAATREEMAHLSYNTLMTVVQVAYSQNTGSYEPKYVNGIYNVTLAEQPWGIHTDEGVIVANKATGANKGTVLERIEDGTYNLQKYYVTEMDEDPTMLGHQVRITYRLETSGSSQVATAFFMEDQCTEVKAAEAVTISSAKSVFSFNNGKLVSYNVPAREVRDKAPGVFVLNADGLVVSYKTEGYFVSTLSMNLLTMQTTVFDPTTNTYVPVQAPAGAVNGSLVTVYHMGDVYTAKLCPSLSGVYIEQRGHDLEGNATYNSGSIYPSKAENLINVSLPLNITRMGGTQYQLELGSKYTLYFDDQGGCIGFSDRVDSGIVAGAEDYGLLLYTYTRETEDTFGIVSKKCYAQVIRGDGKIIDDMVIPQEYLNLTTNTVYKLTYYGNQWYLTLPSNGEVTTAYYSANDPYTDYSSAKFIWYNGKVGGERAISTNVAPKVGTPVIYVFGMDSSLYYGSVRKVKAVWFTEAGTSPTPTVSDDIVYIANLLPTENLVNGKRVYYYEGYRNGAPVTDLYLTSAPSTIGFYTCKRGSDGIYSLTGYLSEGNGTATGVRTVTLNVDNEKALMRDKDTLYLMSTNGWAALSLNNVAVKMVGNAAAITTISITNADELFNYVRAGLKMTITLVESVDNKGIHSVGSNAIYVTVIAG